MKTIFFEVPKEEESVYTSLLADLDISFFEEKLDDKNVSSATEVEILSVFINSELNKDVLAKMPNLKFIVTRSTGYDHIDLEYCKNKGILISNVPAYGSATVAEFTFALLLCLSRKVSDAHEKLQEEGIFSIQGFEGFDLRGKTIGIVGTGKIGKNVIKIAKGFGMNVLAYDLFPDMNFAKENEFIYKTLEEVLAQSDILTLHAPYTKENHHLINKDNIGLLKKGVFLINTARGELIDTDALIKALTSGVVAGAGLDVLEGERELKEEIEILASPEKSERIKDYKTLLEDKVLIDMPNVIVTPHIAFYSKEAVYEIIKTTVGNINAFISGQPENLIK